MGFILNKLKEEQSSTGSNGLFSRIAQSQGQSLNSNTIIDRLAATNSVPGANTALLPARPATQTGTGISDLFRSIPNALADVWSLVKEATYGTAKKVLHDIPVEAFNLVKEQGIGNATKNTIQSIIPATIQTAANLIPQSAKELGNVRALTEIPEQFQSLVKENKGSYANALISLVKSIPDSLPTAVLNYANQIDRARQAVENHPVNEFLGYLGLKSLTETGANLKPHEINSKTNVEVPNKNTVIANMFDTEGIKAPVSALTQNPAIRGFEALSAKGLFGAKVKDIAVKAATEVENRVNQIVERIKPKKTLSDESLGKTLQEGLKEYEEKFKLTEEKIYREFEKTYGKSNVYGQDTKTALSTLIEEQSKDFVGGVDPVLNRALDRISGRNNPELKDLEMQVNEFKSKGIGKVPPELEKAYKAKQAELDKDLTFEELKATRTKVGELMQRSPENTAYKRLYGALSVDMKSAVSKIINEDPFIYNSAKEAKIALDKLNGAYATGKIKIESNIAQSISKSNAESIVKNIIKRNSADTIKVVKEIVGQNRFVEIQQSFLRQIFEESITRGRFDVSKLKKKLSDYDQATLDEILSKDQTKELNSAITQLEKFDTLDEALRSGTKVGEGSQTAFLTKLGVIPGLIFSGHFLWASAILLGDFALKTLYTSDLGRRLLTEGMSPSNLKAVKDLKNLSTAQKQIIIQSFRNNENKE